MRYGAHDRHGSCLAPWFVARRHRARTGWPPFWQAEPAEHQDYLERIPNGYTCHWVRPDWKLPVRSAAVAAAKATS
jgi:hypothetical protein